MPHFFFYRALKKFPGGTPGRTLPVRVLFTGAPALVSKEPVYLPCCLATIFSMSSKKGNAPNIGKALPRCFKVVDILPRLKKTTKTHTQQQQKLLIRIHTQHATRLISSYFGVVVPSAEVGSRGVCHTGVTLSSATLLLLRTHTHIPSHRSHLKSDITRRASSTHNPERCPIRGVSPSLPRFHYRETERENADKGTKAHQTFVRKVRLFDCSELLLLARNVGRGGCGGTDTHRPHSTLLI